MLTSGTPAAFSLAFEKVSLVNGFLCPTVSTTVPIPATAFVITLCAYHEPFSEPHAGEVNIAVLASLCRLQDFPLLSDNRIISFNRRFFHALRSVINYDAIHKPTLCRTGIQGNDPAPVVGAEVSIRSKLGPAFLKYSVTVGSVPMTADYGFPVFMYEPAGIHSVEPAGRSPHVFICLAPVADSAISAFLAEAWDPAIISLRFSIPTFFDSAVLGCCRNFVQISLYR